MNYFLDLAGALLYIAFSIIISPLIILVYTMIFAVTATRYVKAYQVSARKARARARAREIMEPVETMPSHYGLALQKLHLFGMKRSA